MNVFVRPPSCFNKQNRRKYGEITISELNNFLWIDNDGKVRLYVEQKEERPLTTDLAYWLLCLLNRNIFILPQNWCTDDWTPQGQWRRDTHFNLNMLDLSLGTREWIFVWLCLLVYVTQVAIESCIECGMSKKNTIHSEGGLDCLFISIPSLAPLKLGLFQREAHLRHSKVHSQFPNGVLCPFQLRSIILNIWKRRLAPSKPYPIL